tara:strand:+ start:70 stop:612 length:543 start_codon:yes stop_codon:yes gene_type:complete
LFSGIAIAIIMGMIFAGGVTIADAEREDRRRSRNRSEQWNRGRELLREFSTLERYRRLWFNTTFALEVELDHLILFRAKDVFSRALHDTKEGNKDAKEVYKTFEYQLRKTIGDGNFEQVTKSLRPERGRRNIKIGEQGRSRGRSRRSRASEKKRESRNRGSDKKGGDKTGTHKTKIEKKS